MQRPNSRKHAQSRRAAMLHAIAALVFSCHAAAAPLVGIVDANDLVFFDSTSPGTATRTLPITGLQPGEVLLALDVRQLTRRLYALGSSGRVYRINTATGAVGNPGVAPSATLLTGTSFGMDFNPTVDRLRIVSDTEQNFRYNPLSEMAVDGDPVAMGIQPDTPLNPPGNIVALAYDRPDNDPSTPTTAYVIDSTSDRLLRLGNVDGAAPGSPNLGQLNDVGPLGVDAALVAGFDITGDGQALALLNVDGESRLYSIGFGGAALLIGNAPSDGMSGLAVLPQPAIFATGFE